MNIFKAEADIDGLAEKILASQSIAYSTQLLPWTPSEKEEHQKNYLSESFRESANVHGYTLGSAYDSDLFFTKSILVSTNWNKNDDVFSPGEVWASRHTPSHKPTNIEHDEKRLVGHITETWALDVDGNLIPDNTVIDDLPELYHIANGAVIYMNWQDDGLKQRTSELIASIEGGKKYVSMEAIFTNFGYAVVTPENKFHVVARNQETAFLTKHLRAYGGTGNFDGCKIGRLLKNISFSGKGYVDQPANPYSVIFKDGNVFNYSTASLENPFHKKSGVLLTYSNISLEETEKSNMSDTQVDLLKTQIDELKKANAGYVSQIAELKASASEDDLNKLQSEIEGLQETLEAAKKERDEAIAQVETLTSEKEAVAQQLTEATEAKEALETQVAEAEAAKVKADRISILVDGGIEKELATTKVELFANLNNDQFAAVADEIISAKKHMDHDKEEDKEDEKSKSSDNNDDETQDDAETSASDDVLNNAEPTEDVNLNTDASDQSDETEDTRAEMSKAFSDLFGVTEESAE